jgi:hypothetical protein
LASPEFRQLLVQRVCCTRTRGSPFHLNLLCLDLSVRPPGHRSQFGVEIRVTGPPFFLVVSVVACRRAGAILALHHLISVRSSSLHEPWPVSRLKRYSCCRVQDEPAPLDNTRVALIWMLLNQMRRTP